jgi:hypothetical protein
METEDGAPNTRGKMHSNVPYHKIASPGAIEIWVWTVHWPFDDNLDVHHIPDIIDQLAWL